MGKKQIAKKSTSSAAVTKKSVSESKAEKLLTEKLAADAQRPKPTIKKKKDKRKEKHDNFLKKLQAVQAVEEAAKKPEQPLQLSSLSDLLSTLLEKEQTKAKPDNKFTKQARSDLMKKEVEQFKNVVAHPAFKNSPMATIREHLSNKVEATEKAHIDEMRELKKKEREQKKKEKERDAMEKEAETQEKKPARRRRTKSKGKGNMKVG